MRIKNIRSLLCAILLMTCTIFLVACGNKGKDEDENTVPEIKLEAIAITNAPNKTAYVVGEIFNNTGMVVTASYDDNTSKEVTAYTISKTTALAVTDAKVTVSFTDTEVTKTADVAITVTEQAQPNVLSFITVTPLKTAYLVGDTFSTTGMVVTANYTNGKTAVIDAANYTVSKVTALAAADTSVTISYTEGGVTKTAVVAITVTTEAAPKALSALVITTQPSKTAYTVGDTFDKAGMVVTANYNDGSTKVVTDYTLNKTVLGLYDTTITVSFTEGGVKKTADVTVTIKQPEYPTASNSEIFEDVVALIPTADIDEAWIKTVVDTELEKVKTKFYTALSTARITTSEATAIVDVLENLGDYDFTGGPAVFDFVDDLYAAGVSNAKTASFVFDMVVAASDALDALKTAAVIGNFDDQQEHDDFHTIIDQVIEAYDQVIALKKADFTTAFTALLDIARISETGGSALNTHGTPDMINVDDLDRTEFISAVTAYKADLLASLNALTPQAITAIMNLYKSVVPYAIETSIDMQIATLRSELNDVTTDRDGNLSYWQENLQSYTENKESAESAADTVSVGMYEIEIEKANNMIALCQAEKTYHDYRITENTIRKDYYTAVVAYLNTLSSEEQNRFSSISFYESYISSYENEIEYYTDRKQSLSEVLEMFEEIDVDAYITDATTLINDLTDDLVTVRKMLLATVNRIDADMAGEAYDAIKDGDYGAGLIIIGKLMHAGLNAQGGFTEATMKTTAADYVDLVFPNVKIFIMSDDTEYDESDVIEDADKVIADLYDECAALNGKAYGDASVVVVLENYEGAYPTLVNMLFPVRHTTQAGTGTGG